jgi:monoterpene epsilon-lactone hydrolase
MKGAGRLLTAFVLVAIPATAFGQAETPTQDLRDFVPQTISPQARAIFEKMLPGVKAHRATRIIPQTAAEFDANYKDQLARAEAGVEPMLKALGVTPVAKTMNGVGVLETVPPNYHDDSTVLIRVHGGGFIEGSAHSSAGFDAQMAVATGKRIISVDYTVAPRGTWRLVTDQVIAVYKAVLAEGYRPQSIGMFGDSAGGNIVPASILKLRDQGLPMPGAVLLLSPCVDLHLNGDTETTLGHADPALFVAEVLPGLKAYASPAEWNNPYVSPVLGDFTKGFPPVLLQAGTKEMVLSDSVRFYQAVKMAGGDATLDVYEGMTHVFQSYMMGTPEQKEAFAEIERFWAKHLVPTQK